MRSLPLLVVTALLVSSRLCRGADQPAPVVFDRDAVLQMLPALHLLEPIWSGDVVYRESVLPLEESPGGPITGRLALAATEIVSISTADGSRQLDVGADVRLADDGRKVVFSSGAAPDFVKQADLFPAADSGQGYRHRRDHPEQFLLFAEGHWFHDRQFEVTYRRAAGPWPGSPPTVAANGLSRTQARLRAGQPLSIGVSGDSISYGLNASGVTGAAPAMPSYPELAAAQLQSRCGSEVAVRNRAIPGWSVTHGLADLSAWQADPPHLMIVAYGMNDVGRRDPAWFQAQTRALLKRLHEMAPQTEVILVAPMIGYHEWIHTPREMFPRYRDVLTELVGPGVALADLTAVWEVLLRTKHDLDLTGNGLNHPNDFGHRLYAQAILALLMPPASSANSPTAISANSSR